MIRDRLVNLFGEDPQFTLDMARDMKELLLADMSSGRKEEYMSKVGVALLFDRAGGSMTEAMRDVIEKATAGDAQSEALIEEVRKIWNEWDVLKKKSADNCLQCDSFYNEFMAPYFGCFRCDDARKGLHALDMDSDGFIDRSEFLVYLK